VDLDPTGSLVEHVIPPVVGELLAWVMSHLQHRKLTHNWEEKVPFVWLVPCPIYNMILLKGNRKDNFMLLVFLNNYTS